MSEFEVTIDIECSKCGHKETIDTTVDIDPPENPDD